MLEVKNIYKKYPSFLLKDVSFSLPEGYIMGFIGANGAGKSTTLKAILNFIAIDSGEITIFGKDSREYETELKKEIGFALSPVNYYPKTKIRKVANVYKRFFDNWDEETYQNLLVRFNIDDTKKIDDLSMGMKVKLGLSFAMSHNAKLLILDEPTSGLDPVAREELLELFQEIVEDGKHSILFSTHITSDLDKCADYIIFIKDGELIANTTKDGLIESHRAVAGDKEQLTDELKSRLIGHKETPFGFMGLIKTKDILPTDNLQVEKPNLEEIMIYYNKEEVKG